MSAALEESVSVGQRVTVYSTPSCVQCKATYRVLDKLCISYDVIDVTTDPQAEQWVKSLGYVQAPVVVAGGAHWSGFRPDKINELVKVEV